MKTQHEIHVTDAGASTALRPASVHLVVTSPPYPMIAMWDAVFARQDAAVSAMLEAGDGWAAFERMHRILDRVWERVHRALVPGGIACVNVGDATRTLGGTFALYPNHARILASLVRLGFTPLPAILWRKQTNAPNKFMGSGMLPPGAYVTLEHEFVLIARKGAHRPFLSARSKSNRRRSSYFWEERNLWFSDVWFDLKGTGQKLANARSRERSGAFPFELPYRLISMFSAKGETVLDPFLGTGTTMLAAMAAARHSIGCEIDRELVSAFAEAVAELVPIARRRISERLRAHSRFALARRREKGRFGYRNVHYGFPVVTRQEVDLLLDRPSRAEGTGANRFEVTYLDSPLESDLEAGDWFAASDAPVDPDTDSDGTSVPPVTAEPSGGAGCSGIREDRSEGRAELKRPSPSPSQP